MTFVDDAFYIARNLCSKCRKKYVLEDQGLRYVAIAANLYPSKENVPTMEQPRIKRA